MTLNRNDKESGTPVEAAGAQLDEIGDILRRVDALPILNTRSECDILGYGDLADE